MKDLARSRCSAFLLAAIAFALFLTGIQAMAQTGDKPSSKEKIRYFCGKGEVIAIDKEGVALTIKHERIEGFMEAMTMRFKAEDLDVLEGVSAGDHIRFTLKDMPTKYRLIYIEKIEGGK